MKRDLEGLERLHLDRIDETENLIKNIKYECSNRDVKYSLRRV